MSFERQGTGPGERYVAQGAGYVVGLKDGTAAIGLPAAPDSPKNAAGKVLTLGFVGGRSVAPAPLEELPGKVNRYLSSDPAKWQTGLATYSKVAFRDVYKGVDVIYYGNQQQLEFDLAVKPGADPRAVRLRVAGASRLKIDPQGNLLISDNNRELSLALPSIYQEVNGTRRKIAGRYELRGRDEVAFSVDNWDRSKALIIDPTLTFSALIGGGTNSSGAYAAAVDSGNNTLIAGYTYASDFPVAGAAQGGLSIAPDAFVTKINSLGTAIVYSTYFGGTNTDYLQALAVDSTGAAWAAGYTYSSDIPLMNATQGALSTAPDGIVVKLSAAGALQFATYLGGNGYDVANGVAIDSSNNAYVTGETQSSTFSVTAGVVQAALSGTSDAFVVKFSSAGARLYSTFLGGGNRDVGEAIAVDSTGAAYVTGYTYSASFNGAPAGGAQSVTGGNGDAFAAKLKNDGTALSYFTFLGGTNFDLGYAIALDAANDAWVGGYTLSTGLATAGASQAALAGGSDGFLAKVNPLGTAIPYFTYLGGLRQDFIHGVAVDSSGNVTVAGYTDSSPFPTQSPLQSVYPGNSISLYSSSNAPLDSAIAGAVLDISHTTDIAINQNMVVATENGIFRSTDNGATWTQTGAIGYISSLSRSPVTSATIYAVNSGSVYRSLDDGVSWVFRGNGSFLCCQGGVLADPVTAATVYLYSGSGVQVSTDGGATWAAANTGLPGTGVYAMTAASNGTLYASVYGFGIYKSTNHGAAWSAASTGLPSPGFFFTHSLAVSPFDGSLYAASGTIYKSTNGGTSWSAVTGSVPGGASNVFTYPGGSPMIYAVSGSGTWVSTDAGVTWSPGVSVGAPAQIVSPDPFNAARYWIVAPVGQAGFVAKYDSTGARTYSSYFGAAGSSSSTSIYGLALNSSGDAVIAGNSSIGTGGAFPGTTSAFMGNPSYGAFVARIATSTAACSFSLSPATQIASGSAQTVGFSVIAPSGCAWNATSNAVWATVIRGTGETGTDAITVQLAANTSGASRTATISAGGQSVSITQADQSCSYSLSAGPFTLSAVGGPITTNLTTAAGCPWNLSTQNPSAVSITSALSGSGNTTITATVGPNLSLNSRTLFISIGNGSQVVGINQDGTCSFTFTPVSVSPAFASSASSVAVTASASACQWNASSTNTSWLTISSGSSGTGNGTINYIVGANTGPARSAAIKIGTYSFAVNQAAAPVNIASITNAASFAAPPLAPASDASAFGTNLAQSNFSPNTLPWPTNVQGTTVSVNGTLAPISFISPTQINFQIPAGTATGTATVIINNNGSPSNTFMLSIVAAAPGIFSIGNPDLTFNNANNPIIVGTTASIYFTGAGVTTPTVPDGTGNPSSPLAVPNAATTVTINGGTAVFTAPVTLAPQCCQIPGYLYPVTGNVGIAVARVFVPGLANGTYPVVVTTNGVASVPFNIVVGPPTLAISSGANLGTWPSGTDQIPLSATGGNYSYAWNLVSGSLPPGLAIRSDGPSWFNAGQSGLIGVATTPGNYSFTLSVTSAATTVQKTFTLRITGLNLKNANNTLPDAFVNVPYVSAGFQLAAINNAAAVTYTTTSPLPQGMTLSSSGLLSGTPAASGSYPIYVQITDGVDTVSQWVYLNVYAINIAQSGFLPNATQYTPYTPLQLTASGGTPPYTFTVNCCLPSGFAMSTAGLITGTSTSVGVNTFQVTVKDANNVSVVRNLAIDVIGLPAQQPRISGTFINDAVVGNNFNWGLSVCCGGTPPYQWSVSGQPAGMTIRQGVANSSAWLFPNQAELWGIPQTAGDYNLQLTVTDATNVSTTAVIPLHVSPLDSDYPANGTINVAQSQTIRILGGTGPYTAALKPGPIYPGTNLPDGLSFTNATKILAGTPLETGNFNLTVKYTDTTNPQNTLTRNQGFNIAGSGSTTISISTGSLLGPDLVGANPVYNFAACCVAGYTWSMVSGTLPPGRSLSAAGQLSGTLTTAGTYTFLVKVADSGNASNVAFRQFTEIVTPISITTASVSSAILNAAYTPLTFAATGGVGALTWSLQANSALPPGMTLSSAGVLSGTPTSLGLYNFWLLVTDTSGNVANKNFNLNVYTVGPPLSLSQGPTICNCAIGAQNLQLTATGGTPPYHFSYSPGATPIPNFRVQDGAPLPTGFPGTTTAGFLGVATVAGSWTTSLRVTDSVGGMLDKPITLNVADLNILNSVSTGTQLPKALAGTPYSYQFTPTGGSNNYVWTVNTGLNGSGLSLSATGLLSGATPVPGTYTFTINLADATNPSQTYGFSYTIVVNPFAITDGGILPQGIVNTAYSHQFSAPSCGAGCTWSISSGSAPTGMSLSSSGLLSGTFTSIFGTNISFTIQAAGANGTVQKVFAFLIPPTPSSSVIVTTAITTTLKPGDITDFGLAASGGAPPYTWSVTAGSLPTGVTLQNTGENIFATGIPGGWYLAGKAMALGTYNFTLKATDSLGASGTKAFTWNVVPLYLSYTSLPLSGTSLLLNTAYSQAQLPIGGSGSYTSFTPAAAIYPGLSGNTANGTVSGTPLDTGSLTTAWTLVDNTGNTAVNNISINAASNANTTVTINGGPNFNQEFTPGGATTFNLTGSGGTGPYTIAVAPNTTLPTGIALVSGNAGAAGNPAGSYQMIVSPTAAGTITWRLQITDVNNVVGQRTYSIVVPSFNGFVTTTLPDASVGVAYSQKVFNYNSSTTAAWSLTPGAVAPPGMSFAAGVLSGTPTTAGDYWLSTVFADAAGSVTVNITLHISALAITNALTLPNAVSDFDYTAGNPLVTMTATGGANLVWSATGLPFGLVLDAATGAITGNTTSVGRFSVVITVANANSTTTKTFNLYVEPANASELDYNIQSANNLPDGIIGHNYASALVPNGGTPPYSFALAQASTLPPGLGLVAGATLPSNFAPGITELLGIPTTAGQYTFDLVITDSTNAKVTRTFHLNVGTMNFVALPGTATLGVPYSQQLTIFGGTAPYTFSINASNNLVQDALPSGLTLSASGLLSGTPTSTGAFNYTIKVLDAAGKTFTFANTLNRNGPKGLRINSPSVAGQVGSGTNGFAFSTSGLSAYTWSKTAGALPTGVTLNSDGSVTGFTTTAGVYQFMLHAVNNADAGDTADRLATWTVSPMHLVQPVQSIFAGGVLPVGAVGSAYSFTYKIAGGKPPYTFAESPVNPLPPGMTLSAAGLLSGTPTQSGGFIIRPVVTDANGATFINSSLTLIITPTAVKAPLQENPNGNAGDFSLGVPSLLPLDRYVWAGVPPYTWTISNGSLPAGMALLNGGNGVSTFMIGTPTAAGTSTFTLTATDAANQTWTTPVEFVVSPLTLSPATLPPATTLVPYSLSFIPAGGTAPYTVSIDTSFSIPPGLTLTNGVLSGTPQYAGVYFLKVKTTDSAAHTLVRLYDLVVDDAAGEAPTLTLAPDPVSLFFTTNLLPAAVPVAVNSSSGTLSYTASVLGIAGASLSANGGTTNGSFNLMLPALAAGVYNGVIPASAATAANGGYAVPVTITVAAPPPCAYSLNPTGNSIPIGGGNGSFQIATAPGCAWTATPSDPAITITSAASGAGQATVTYTVSANNGVNQRNANIGVAGQTYSISQFGQTCSFSISPSSLMTGAAGGTATVNITASDPSCTWNTSGALTVSPASGMGSQQVGVTIPANAAAVTAMSSAVIAGQTLNVTQSGVQCTVTLPGAGAAAPVTGGQGSIAITIPNGCSYNTIPGPGWISITSGASGSASGTLIYNVDANSTTSSRSGFLTIGGMPYQITQPGIACSITLDTSGLGSPFAVAGGVGTIAVNANGANCPWTAVSNSTFANVSPPGGSGSGSVSVTVSSNAASVNSRGGSVTVAGQAVGFMQGGTTCAFTLRSLSATAPSGGGSGSVGVIAPAACNWTSKSNDAWLSIISTGTGGTADVLYVAQPNAAGTPRAGTLTIAGITYTVNEAGAPCSYSLASGSVALTSAANNGTVGFSTAQAGCTTPAAAVTSYANWITATNTSAGSGQMSYSVLPNASGAARKGTVQVGDQLFTITQSGAPCSYSLSNYGAVFGVLGGNGSFLATGQQGCVPNVGATTQPSIVTVSPLAGPVGNIYTQPFVVTVFNSLTNTVRRATITFNGLNYTIKQTSW
jgi:hypothetical protein